MKTKKIKEYDEKAIKLLLETIKFQQELIEAQKLIIHILESLNKLGE